MTGGRRPAAPKREKLMIAPGIYGRLLQRAEHRRTTAEMLADELLAGALDRAAAVDERQQREERYRAAVVKARKNNDSEPLRRDFGL